MTLVALDHVQLAMPRGEEARARAFYEGILGLAHVEKPAALAKRGGCWFRGAGFEIHLGVEDDFRAAKKAHPGMVSNDLDALAKALAAHGHEVRWSKEIEGVLRFHTDDPFGNRLELIAAAAPSL